ncbi:MAG: tRNA uridine-5-carboxymethylaminomethyl(34) synthesis GTPase MnmE [Desulfobacterales bacterium]|nr:MAG: tRNA uridine-5-carboxymethylaminomethyl(34) synthesis GTPase MnmE [Desulfobacterales bacterium]
MRTTPTTIAAIATPPGSGGIGIIRISGPNALAACLAVFRRHLESTPGNDGRTSVFSPASHRLYHGFAVSPKTGLLLDEVLFCYMRAPRSYTREDVAEIHCHGGPAALHQVLEAVLAAGAAPADPGEFTRRAFLNGRIDLPRAEAVIDIIQADHDAFLNAAADQLRGGLSHEVAEIRQRLLGIKAEAEARIDFPDDMDEAQWAAADIHKDLIVPIEALIRDHEERRLIRDGVRVAIIGMPNVGKSSIMNRLLRQERSIVTPVPGTTRDVVDGEFRARGLILRVSDTAGIRDTEDPVEKIGVERSRQAAMDADILLVVTDAGDPSSLSICSELSSDLHERQTGASSRKPRIVWAHNKSDLPSAATPAHPDFQPPDASPVFVSAKTGDGMDALSAALTDAAPSVNPGSGHRAIPNLRHARCLRTARNALLRFRDGEAGGIPPDILMIDLREADDALASLLGISVADDVLDHIFSRFCIGK